MPRPLPMSSANSAADLLRNWAVHWALPLWASAGFDGIYQRFEERLALDGKPIVDVPIRLMVQARQVYSFGVAAKRQWYSGARDLVEKAYVGMVRDYYKADGADGWVFSIHREASVADGKRDLYAHAFVLLAIASYVEVVGRQDALALAEKTLTYLDHHMRAPNGAGYIEALPTSDTIRRQNPHMHLLEALLALWQVSGERSYLARAQEMFDLFRERFFRPIHGVLGEYYDERLDPAAGEAGKIVEPGHHYEWIWLLRRYAAASGENVQSFVDALYAHADRNGFAANRLIVDELFVDGRVRVPTHRVWPMTEAIKANVVEGLNGRAEALEKVAELAANLLASFLVSHPAGGWLDRLDETGKPAAEFMPASTLYHIMCALDVLHAPQAKA